MTGVKSLILLVAVLFYSIESRYLQTESDTNPESPQSKLDVEDFPITEFPSPNESATDLIQKEISSYSNATNHQPSQLFSSKLLERLETSESTKITEEPEEGSPQSTRKTDEENQTDNPESEVVELIETGAEIDASPKDHGSEPGFYYVQAPGVVTPRVSYVTALSDSGLVQSSPVIITQPLFSSDLVPGVFS